jgi:ribosome-binding factor A
MGERKIRVGELIGREISGALHSRWRSESVAITIAEVDISPDLRNARVYYSVLGDREAAARAEKFLMSVRKELREIIAKNIRLKFTPALQFVYDPSYERGMRVLAALDELDEESSETPEEPPQEDEGEDAEEE